MEDLISAYTVTVVNCSADRQSSMLIVSNFSGVSLQVQRVKKVIRRCGRWIVEWQILALKMVSTYQFLICQSNIKLCIEKKTTTKNLNGWD